MVKKDSKRIFITADSKDQDLLNYLQVKLGLTSTQVYRLALRQLAQKERKEE